MRFRLGQTRDTDPAPHGLCFEKAQVALLFASFRYGWPLALIIFGLHLGVVGYLIVRSTYAPKILGALLVLDGAYWVANGLRPYVFPGALLGPLFYFTFVELAFMIWLLFGALVCPRYRRLYARVFPKQRSPPIRNDGTAHLRTDARRMPDARYLPRWPPGKR